MAMPSHRFSCTFLERTCCRRLLLQMAPKQRSNVGQPKNRKPKASSLRALRRMKTVRRRDTNAEMELRRQLFSHGLRYRVDRNVLDGSRRRADIVFSAARVAVFVDGCFWHCCPLHRSFPKSNSRWWREKLSSNRRRDADTNKKLRRLGWHVERIWEHENPTKAAERISRIVLQRRK